MPGSILMDRALGDDERDHSPHLPIRTLRDLDLFHNRRRHLSERKRRSPTKLTTSQTNTIANPISMIRQVDGRLTRSPGVDEVDVGDATSTGDEIGLGLAAGDATRLADASGDAAASDADPPSALMPVSEEVAPASPGSMAAAGR
jgi:hypothetical protein